MKRITIVWTITLVIIVVGLTAIGFKIKADNIDNIMEKAILEEARSYLNYYTGSYPEKGETTRLENAELKEKGYDAKLDEEDCTGYVIITNEESGFKYKPYVKCPNYTTEGYEEK